VARPPGAVARATTPETEPPAMRAPDASASRGASTDESAVSWRAELAGEQRALCVALSAYEAKSAFARLRGSAAQCVAQLAREAGSGCAEQLAGEQKSLCAAQFACEAKPAFAGSLANPVLCGTPLAREARSACAIDLSCPLSAACDAVAAAS